jgi:hypothetical protein
MPAKLSCACAPVQAAERDVMEYYRPIDRISRCGASGDPWTVSDDALMPLAAAGSQWHLGRYVVAYPRNAGVLPAGALRPTVRPKPPSGANWIPEIKHDGYRVVQHAEKG